jgi:TetR/AcrR family transcriptional regulator, cholesterol catabolism regulator
MEKREQIIQAAVTLFSQTHNVKKVSLEAIAEAAHVSPTSIYNNFGTRDALVYEVVKELARSNIERNKTMIESNIPFPQKLIGIISGKVDMTDKVNGEIIEKMLGQDKTIAPYIDEIYEKEIKPLWVKIMADGKKEGYVDPTLDENSVIIYLDILQAGLKAKMEIFKDIKDNMGLLQQLTRIMFYGFLKKDIDLFQKEEKQAHE